MKNFASLVLLTMVSVFVSAQEAVDLGLTIKWASYNIGASKPEECGDYFAWAETAPKTTYSWQNYKYTEGGVYDAMTKYCIDGGYGIVDDKKLLEPEDDAATANWGEDWRTPTSEEWEELATLCNWEQETLNGMNGYRITATNGNSIFLPAAGYRDQSETHKVGDYGAYWTANLLEDEEYPDCVNIAADYSFGLAILDWGNGNRFYGNTVRAVYQGSTIGTAIDMTTSTPTAAKKMIDGKIVIITGNKIYDIIGQEQ